MIRVVDLHKHFGGVRAVDGASLEIEQGAITGLIGPNGAGKTTLFNVVAGVYPPTSGRVYLGDEDVTGMRPHRLFDRGLARTFQIAHEFATLTVVENLMASVGEQTGESLTGAWLRPGRVRAEEARIRRRAEEVIEFLDLGEVAGKPAGELSGGQKKLVELARVMMTGARVVLLDEIGAGVNRTLLRSIAGAILRLNIERGYTFCMIEHDMDLVSLLCDPVIVMTEGRVLTQGPAPDVQADERVIEAYLGTRSRSAPS
ncbi:MAG: ABC transporter ATP-binding protein [Defluviicoccus sp.]|nr:ABC transporter ATP-binding protein [Defluviicoccus sp.]